MAPSEHVFGTNAGGFASSPLLLPIRRALKTCVSVPLLVWSLVLKLASQGHHPTWGPCTKERVTPGSAQPILRYRSFGAG